MTHYNPGSLSDRLQQRIAAISPIAANNFILGVRGDGYWAMHADEKQRICSFLRSLVTHEDMSSRLTLYPGIADDYFMEEFMTDVFPLVRFKLENLNGT